MPRTCGACGTTTDASSARWCGHCGARLEGAAPSASTGVSTPGAARPGEGGTATRVRPLDDLALVGAPAPAVPIPDEPVEEEVAPPTWSVPARLAVVVGVVAVVLGALVLRPDPEPVFEARGFTARGDAARTGVVSLAPLDAPTRVAWEVRVPDLSQAVRVVSGGDLIVETGLASGQVTVRESTGEVRWVRGDLGQEAAFRAGEAIVQVGPLEARGLDIASGFERWRIPVNGPERGYALPDGGLLLEDTRAGTLRRVDTRTGETVWSRDLPDELGVGIAGLSAAGDRLGVWATSPPGLGPDSPRVEHLAVVLDAVDGSVRFTRRGLSFLPPTAGPVAVGGDGTVVVEDRTALRFLGRDGQEGARVELESVPMQLVATETQAVVHPESLGLRAYTLDGQQVLWERPDLDDTRVLLATDLTVFAIGTRTEMLDAATGVTILTLPVPIDLAGVLRPHFDSVVAGRRGNDLIIASTLPELVTYPLLLPAVDAPAVAEDRVYLGTTNGVEVHDVADGDLVWEYTELDTSLVPTGVVKPVRTPAVAGTTVVLSPPGSIFGGGPGIVALERTGGIRAWDRDGDTPIVRGPMTLVGSTVFLPVDAEVHGYDTVNGRRAFAAVADAVLGPLVVSPNRVIGAASREPGMPGDTAVVAILRRDRSQAWRAELDTCSGPALAGDRVVWGTTTGIVALAEATGEPLWDVGTSLPVCTDPVVVGGQVVVVDDSRRVRSLGVDDGATLWTSALATPVAAPPVAAGDVLLVPLLDGTLVALDVATGDERWSYDVGAPALSSPVVADGRIVLHLRGGRLVALER